MYTYGSEQHERAQKFEEWQQATAEALQRPGVSEQLGQLGVQLAELHQNAFLLNVRGGEVQVPSQYVDTNHVGILPYLDSDRNLRPHDTLVRPTPGRRELVRDLLGQLGLDATDHALNGFIDRSFADIDPEQRAALVNPKVNAHGGALNGYNQETGIMVTSRPLIVPKWQAIPQHRALMGGVGAHELVHALDVEALMGEADIFYRAQTELRGYRVGAIVAEAAILKGELDRWQFEEDDDTTIDVEKIRQDFNVDSGALLNGDPQLEDNDVVLFMGIMGYFDF